MWLAKPSGRGWNVVEHTSQSDGDNVMARQDRWNGVGLDGGRRLVAAALDVVENSGVEASIIELR